MSLGRFRREAMGLACTQACVAALILSIVPPVAWSDEPARRVTRSQFEQAVQLARLAAKNGMHSLSFRALRAALEAGPPLDQTALANLGRSRRILGGGVVASVRNANGGSAAAVERQVVEQLEELSQLWLQSAAPAEDVYETLAAIVLPEHQPHTIVLYALPLMESGVARPVSVGRLLVQWAARAGKLADLRSRVEARQARAEAELAAHVLFAQIGNETHDLRLAARSLAWIDERLATQPPEHGAEMAAHALGVLRRDDFDDAAASLLEGVVKAMGKIQALSPNDESYGNMILALARVQFQRGNADLARQHLDDYLAAGERQNVRYAGDYGIRRRFEQLHAVVRELVAAKRPSDALHFLAPCADLNSTGYAGISIGPTLARLSRQLAALPAGERYRLLKAWTMPEPNRRSVRVISGFAAPEKTPANWMLDERPTSTGPTPILAGNVASTATMLIDAARVAGQLDDLLTTARDAAGEKCENGELFYRIVEVSRGATRGMEPRLRQWIDERRASLPAQGDGSRRIQWLDYLLARACLEDEVTRPLGEDAARVLITHSQRIQDHLFMPQCRTDLWAGMAARDAEAHIAIGSDPDLAHWHPASHQSAMIHRGGSAAAWWVAHEGHIAHAGGPDHEFLYFNYPLIGKFTVELDALEGGFGEGNVSYGGLVFEALHLGTKTQIWPVGKSEVVWLPDPLEIPLEFNRLRLEIDPSRTRYYVNDHLVYEDAQPSATSPWLALFSNRLMQTVFRNVRITGEPQIPRQVPLSHQDRLEGWISSFYGETQPPRRSIGRTDEYGRGPTVLKVNADDYDWRAEEGTIYGRRVPYLARNASAESRLYYHRPLRNGETIAYEFRYQPGVFEVHPALDRLTFLVSPTGVRLHWMTDGADDNASWLDPDNQAEEPAAHRGPEVLPLKPGEWNEARLSLADDQVVLAINGTEVFRRTLEESNDRLFGFFHYKHLSAVQVRNVVLSGDWPATLTAQMRENLAVATGRAVTAATRLARHAMVDEQYLSRNAWNVWRAAQNVPPAQRYETLAAWVLPNDDHPTFRLRGDFTPTDGLASIGSAWQFVAPAIELVKTAKKIGRLSDLTQRVAFAPANDDVERRGKLAMNVLLALARGSEAQADHLLRQMYILLKQLPGPAPELHRWPDLLVATEALAVPGLRHTVEALADLMVEQQQQSYVTRDWEQYVRHLRGVARLKAHPTARASPFGGAPPLAQWKPATLASADTRGKGYPPAHWRAAEGRVEHTPGHRCDLLYFAVPLRGDFQVDAQLTSFGWRETELMYNNLRLRLHHDMKHYQRWHFHTLGSELPIEPPLGPLGQWYDFRLVVKDDVSTSYVNGRKMHEERLPAEPDPWLAIYCEGHFDGAARKVRITGSPAVPDEIDLSSATDLTSWSGLYYGEAVTGENAAWKKQGDEIEGIRLPQLEGSFRESLLQYHRPLMEDGELEYEFFYVPGAAEVHPCLDRLALVLRPEGVRLHWLTDAQFDRTGRLPENSSKADEKAEASVPLKLHAWNLAKLTLRGGHVSLAINGAEVCRRTLEASNERLFGLFHYADQTVARVKHVRYRGAWPRSLPPTAAQELAVEPIQAAVLDAGKLRRQFTFDFRNAVDPRQFRLSSEIVANYVHLSPEGARVTLPGDREKPGTAGYATCFGVRGDFEIEVAFEATKAIQPAAGFGSGFDLHAQFAGTNDHAIIERRLLADARNVIHCGHGTQAPDGEYRWYVAPYPADATTGRHKLVRKGAVVYYLFAANDGPYVLYDQRTVGTEDVKFVEIVGRAFDRQSAVDVVIKRFAVRAEDLLDLVENDRQ